MPMRTSSKRSRTSEPKAVDGSGSRWPPWVEVVDRSPWVANTHLAATALAAVALKTSKPSRVLTSKARSLRTADTMA